MKTVTKDITIVNKNGLHARPSSMFVKTACKFKSDISVELGDIKANGKSVMGMLTLGAACGKVLHVETKGDDADNLMDAIEDVIKNFVAED